MNELEKIIEAEPCIEIVGSEIFVMNVTDNEEQNATSRHAVIKFTPQLAVKIAGLRKELMRMKGLYEGIYEITSFGTNPIFVSECSYEDVEVTNDEIITWFDDSKLSEKGVMQILIPELIQEKIKGLRIDTILLHVSEFGVKWSGYVKHTNIKVTTEKISYENLMNGLPYTAPDWSWKLGKK